MTACKYYFYMKTDKSLMQPVCRAAAANVWEASLQPARRQVNTELNHNQLTTSMYYCIYSESL